MKMAGIVLAAGASQRMGSPKALLRGPDGIPLAARQAEVLRKGGCDPVAVVAGAYVAEVRAGLSSGLAVVENPRWAQGRATSVQTGLRAFPDADGWLFLPVDAAGVKAETIREILAAAEKEPQAVLRPVHQGEKGNLLWVPREAGLDLLQQPASARVDEWARPRARILEVDDPAILRNLNVPEEWAAFVRSEEIR